MENIVGSGECSNFTPLIGVLNGTVLIVERKRISCGGIGTLDVRGFVGLIWCFIIY
jgi:hypothetical protein